MFPAVGKHLSQPGALNLHPLAHSPIAVRTSSHINETAQNMKAAGESSLMVASVSQLSAHCTARLTPWPAAGYVWDIMVPSFVLGHVKTSSDTMNSRVLWVPGSRFCLSRLSSLFFCLHCYSPLCHQMPSDLSTIPQLPCNNPVT